MKQIPLTRGQFALVDDADYEWLNQWKWCATKIGNTYYAVRGDGHNKMFYMHREILGLTDRNVYGDHKDRNGLNNQRSNLRIATKSQNQSNRKGNKNSSSKYLGVSWFARDKKWKAQIAKLGVYRHLGCYELEIDAAIAYNKAALSLHGEFANLNDVTNLPSQ